MNVRSLFFLCTLTTFPVQAMTMQPVGARVPNGVRISEFAGRLLLNGEGVREKYSVGLYVGAFCPARRRFGVVGHLVEPPANRLAMYFVYSEMAKRKPDFAWGENFEKNPPVQQPAPPRSHLPACSATRARVGRSRRGQLR